MVQLYAFYQEVLEKKAMGFRMTRSDNRFIKYGVLFERNLMDLSVEMSLEEALDTGWRILSECFVPEETGLRTELIKRFWPENKTLVNVD
jgi:V/A-type H+-transporting ATPase subunit B